MGRETLRKASPARSHRERQCAAIEEFEFFDFRSRRTFTQMPPTTAMPIAIIQIITASFFRQMPSSKIPADPPTASHNYL